MLAGCYRTSLALAASCGIRSIAFPAISCGVYGYPVDRACTIAVREVRAFLREHESVRRVIFVAFSPKLEMAYLLAMGRDMS